MDSGFLEIIKAYKIALNLTECEFSITGNEEECVVKFNDTYSVIMTYEIYEDDTMDEFINHSLRVYCTKNYSMNDIRNDFEGRKCHIDTLEGDVWIYDLV